MATQSNPLRPHRELKEEDHYVEIYIGPCGFHDALRAIEKEALKWSEKYIGLSRRYKWGASYAKTTHPALGEPVPDYQRARILIRFEDVGMAQVFLNRQPDGSIVEEDVPDPNWIEGDPMVASTAEFRESRVGDIPLDKDGNQMDLTLGEALGIDYRFPIDWVLVPSVPDTISSDVKAARRYHDQFIAKPPLIRKMRTIEKLEINMTPEVAASRSLADDTDRLGSIFHTTPKPMAYYPIDPNVFNTKQLKIKDAFTRPPFTPGERLYAPDYIRNNRAVVLQHFARYSRTDSIPKIVTEDPDIIIEFSTAEEANIAFNLKCPNLAIGTIPLVRGGGAPRGGATSSRGTSRGGATSSRGISRGGASTSTRGAPRSNRK